MEVDLSGLIDMHVHSAPDTRPRYGDDIDLARAAAQAGMRAILLKSHVTITADRAQIAEKVVPGVRVFGSLTLNEEVGGLNPAAVEAAIRLGAREIWMPTRSAANELEYLRRTGAADASNHKGITVLQADGHLVPAVREILALIAEADIVLGTGHISAQEVKVLVPAAVEQGVHRVLVTHPELPLSNIPLELQKALALPGVWFERCYASTFARGAAPFEAVAADIRVLGPARNILTTDCGLASLPPAPDGLRAYLCAFLELGFSWQELMRMTKDNPEFLLRL